MNDWGGGTEKKQNQKKKTPEEQGCQHEKPQSGAAVRGTERGECVSLRVGMKDKGGSEREVESFEMV